MAKKPQGISAFLYTEPVEKNVEDSVKDEILLKIIDEVFSKKDIEVKTDINDPQVIAFSKGKLYANRFNSDIVSEFVDLLSIYSVSKGRKSRKEFKEISIALNSMNAVEDEPRIRDRLLGK